MVLGLELRVTVAVLRLGLGKGQNSTFGQDYQN